MEQELWQARRGGRDGGVTLTDEQIASLRQIAGTRDPRHPRAGRVLGNSWQDYQVRVGPDQLPSEQRAFMNAWLVLSCEFGAPCGTDTPRMLQACAMQGIATRRAIPSTSITTAAPARLDAAHAVPRGPAPGDRDRQLVAGLGGARRAPYRQPHDVRAGPSLGCCGGSLPVCWSHSRLGRAIAHPAGGLGEAGPATFGGCPDIAGDYRLAAPEGRHLSHTFVKTHYDAGQRAYPYQTMTIAGDAARELQLTFALHRGRAGGLHAGRSASRGRASVNPMTS
jgi:hypothetical protein